MARKAVLVLTGAWHVPQHYQLLTTLLSSSIRTICPLLPTNNNACPPVSGLHHDTAYIRDIIAAEAAAGTHLTVVAHSWGGVVASAVCADFAIKPSETDKGGVTNILYMTAFMPAENQSLAGMFGGQLPPTVTPQQDGTAVWDQPKERFFADVDEAETDKALKLLVRSPTHIHFTPITCEKVAWRVVPVSYLICEQDAALPAFVQEDMVKKVRAEGMEVREFRLPASHSPFLSMPDRVAEIVKELVAAY